MRHYRGPRLDPPDDDTYIFPEGEELLTLLEDAQVEQEVCDKALAIVARLCMRIAELEGRAESMECGG